MLVSAQRVYGDFDKIVLLDRAGEARVGASVLNGGSARPFVVSGSSATKEFFTVPMQTGQNYRSDVFLGNGFDRTVPEVVFSAAVVTPSGAREGIIKGSLNLSRIGRIAGDLVDPSGTSLMVVDNRGMVIGAAGLGAPGILAHVGGTHVGAVHPGLRRRRVSRRRARRGTAAAATSPHATTCRPTAGACSSAARWRAAIAR